MTPTSTLLQHSWRTCRYTFASSGDTDAPCGEPCSLSVQLPIFDDPRGQPLTDQPQDPFIRDPVPEEPHQPVPIKLPKKSRISASSTQLTFFR